MRDRRDQLLAGRRDLVIDPQRGIARIAAGAASPADADIDHSRPGPADGQPATDVEGAIAAAAADRLGDDADTVVARRRGIAADIGDDIAGMAAGPARSADPDIDSASAGAGKAGSAGDVEPAVTAAATK